MTEWNTSERAALEQKRRRAFQEAVPETWCPRCDSLVYDDEEQCFSCGSPVPDEGWPRVDESGDPYLGRIIEERYLLTRLVASGAKARIYQADSRVIPRSFAVKIMDVAGGPDLDHEGLRRRLRREVEALSSLRNPHIVSFYDVFDVGDHNIAFVMDLISGVSLDDLVVEHGALPIPRTVGLLRQLANGLFEAHSRDLVHKDLKPSNVMIETLPAGDDFVRLLDFGVVWVRGTVQDTGAFDSAPVFSSPEQIRREPVDARADVYSLGALAFFMLTGQPPFSRSGALQDVEVMLEETAPTLEEVTGRIFPASVEALVGKMLEKDPARRPQELSAVISWLDEIVEDALDDPVSYGIEEESEEIPGGSSSTSLGMIPTLGDASSPVLKLAPSEMSSVSEASIVESPTAMACRGEGFAYVQGTSVIWSGDYDGQPDGSIDPEMRVLSMAVSPDRALLGTEDGSIVSVQPGRPGRVLFQDPRQAPMTSIAMVADGSSALAGSQSGRLYMSRGEEFMRMGSGDEAATAVALNERGDQFAVARGTSLQVLAVSASNLSTFPLPIADEIVSLAFAPDDYLIAVLTAAGTVVLESVHTGQEFMRLDTGSENLHALTFSSDNHLMGLFLEGDHAVLRTLT